MRGASACRTSLGPRSPGIEYKMGLKVLPWKESLWESVEIFICGLGKWFGDNVIKKGNLFWGSLEAHDGHLSELTTRMARLGCYGKYPGNIERDLCTLLESPIQSLWLEIPVRCEQNRRDIELKKLPVICPHLLYEYLHVS